MNHDPLGKVGIDVGHIAVSSTDDGWIELQATSGLRRLIVHPAHDDVQ